MVAYASSGTPVQPVGASGLAAVIRPGDDRQSIRAVARGAPATGFPLQRGDVDGIRSGALSADGRAGLLLWRHQIPLSPCHDRHAVGTVSAGHVGASRSATG